MQYLNRKEIGENEREHLLDASVRLEKFGITYFSYGLISEGTVVNNSFSHEQWGHYYKLNHYENKDPLVYGVVQANLPLIIWDALHPHGEERKVMAERNEMCGIKAGMTIGIKSKHETEIIALGAAISANDFYTLLNDEHHFKQIHEIVKDFYSAYKQALKGNQTRFTHTH